jgi:hypothetical protein
MDESGKVLRDKIQSIIGSLSLDNKENHQCMSEPSTAQGTPLVHCTSLSGRSSVRDILALIDSERAKRPSSAISVVKNLETHNRQLSVDLQDANLKLMESHAESTKKIAELGNKHARHVSALQSELTTFKEAKEQEIAQLSEKLQLKYKRDEERFRAELERAKSSLVSKEKENRRKWEQKKLVEIKQQTSKALAPEIDNILAAHRIEVEKLETRHRDELETLRDTVSRELRREAEETIERERKAHLERESQSFQAFNDKLERVRRELSEQIDRERKEAQDRLYAAECMHSEQSEKKLVSVIQELSAEKESAIHQVTDRITKQHSEALEASTAEWKERLAGLEEQVEKLEDALERTEIENNMMQQQLRISERESDIFKATELAVLEEKLRELMEEKNKEIEHLTQQVTLLQQRCQYR